jgi:hypothetical protein
LHCLQCYNNQAAAAVLPHHTICDVLAATAMTQLAPACLQELPFPAGLRHLSNKCYNNHQFHAAAQLSQGNTMPVPASSPGKEQVLQQPTKPQTTAMWSLQDIACHHLLACLIMQVLPRPA